VLPLPLLLFLLHALPALQLLPVLALGAIVPGLSPTTAPAIASVDSAQSFPGNGSNEVLVNGLDGGVCPAGQYEFMTFDPPVDPTANVDTSFTFVIP
jgi:hypothetical protein